MFCKERKKSFQLPENSPKFFLFKPHMKNFIWIGAVVIILISLMFWGVSGGNTIKPPFEVGVVHPLDHVSGNASSSVVVIEYSDFQCPACRTYYPVTKQLIAEFGNEIAFVTGRALKIAIFYYHH